MIAKSLPQEDHVSILGFLLTSRGIKVNPIKWQAIISMRSPQSIKEVQQLNGYLAALSRFLPMTSKHFLPLYQLWKKGKKFEYTDDCAKSFQIFKQYLGTLTILTRPAPDEVLYVYLAVADEVVATALIRETKEGQSKYFPDDVRRKNEIEFLKLEQGSMSIRKYAAKFEDLSKISPDYQNLDERSKCVKFKSGLRLELKKVYGH
ncbi:PREDICTED: uncharacterized protein LOC109350509 [Lupinus angustifolius]|uniref:uncharacterized protein LOC109350509 n=1 Tax=Lupinus angustifolius TaxID=3871 RepID=UPI00092E6865|nr:PREDICTED: uncharacterized protein LOC109350509 [Lupinus angustifolius]